MAALEVADPRRVRPLRSLLAPLVIVVAAVAAGAAVPPAAGAASADVAALQVAMRGVGLYHGGIDGVSGPGTRGAVRTFQARHGLAADGVAGAQTRGRLGGRGRPRLGARALRSGQRGWDVAALQFLLGARGFAPGAVDGGYGSATVAAVHRFQRAVGLEVDSVAGPRTLAALRGRTVAAAAAGTTGAPSGSVAFLRPVAGVITDGFGWVGGRRHTGLDFPEPAGVPVGAAGRGVVSWAGFNTGGYGNLVVVEHRLGFETWYAHLSVIGVRAGQAVAGGTSIGAVGSTGHSTGPHLHFEVRRYGTPIDPRPLLLATRSLRAASVGRPVVRPLRCAPNADARGATGGDPWRARLDRCP